MGSQPQLHPHKSLCAPSALCRLVVVLAAVFVLFALFQWEEHIPGLAYLRKRAKKFAPPSPFVAPSDDAQGAAAPDAGARGDPELDNVDDEDKLHDDGVVDDEDNAEYNDDDHTDGESQHPPPAPVDASQLEQDPPSSDGHAAGPASGNPDPPSDDHPRDAPQPVTDPLLSTDLDHKGDSDSSTAPAPAAAATKPNPQFSTPLKLTDEPCRKYIVYDKPVKTGSSAISSAISAYLETIGRVTDICTRDECTAMARDICAGKRKPRVLFGHLYGEDGLLECLRDRGYYVVTSVREPQDRWESAYLFNKKKKGTHYGISYQKGYRYFMENFPPCALLNYYDSGPAMCRDGPIQDRIDPLLGRYDEIIDLYEEGEPRGQLMRIISEYMHTKNKSPRPASSFREPFDKTRLQNETVVYNALKERREQILREGQVPLCQ